MGDLPERGEPDVAADGVVEDQSFALAVLRDDDDAGADGVPRPPDPDRIPVPEQGAGTRRPDPAEDAREPRAARADEAGDAEHLTGVQFEADRLDVRAQLEVARLQHDAFAGRPPRGPLADVAPHHEADELVRRQPLDLARRDDAPVLQHRRAVGEAEDLREPVRDVEDAEPARLELLDDREHTLELGAGEDRRRLVEDENARVERERTCDLDELALGDAEPRDLAAERDLHADAVERLSRLPPHRPAPEDAGHVP